MAFFRRTAATAALLVSSLSGACGPQAEEHPLPVFTGISDAQPTGSPEIEPAALAAAYDMTTLTEDGQLRDFGPHGLHGALEPEHPSRRCLASPENRGEERCLEPLTEPGPVSGARVFRAVEDRIDLPEGAPFDLNGPLTIAAWVRVDSLGLHQHIAACDDKWALWVTPGDQYRLGIRGAGWSSPEGAVEAAAWAAVVAVLRGTKGDPLDPSTASLWVNGRLQAAEALMRTEEAAAAGAWNPGELFADDACHLGFESHQGMESHKTLPFVGAIDELLVFGRAWTEAEVQAFSRSAG